LIRYLIRLSFYKYAHFAELVMIFGWSF